MSKFYRKTSVASTITSASTGSLSAVIDRMYRDYLGRTVVVNKHTDSVHVMSKGTIGILLRLGYPHILARCATPQVLTQDAQLMLSLMNHRAIRALETYIAVYEAMGWEPPGSPKRLLNTISEIEKSRTDPVPGLFEEVARMMAIVCASKDVFFFQTIGRWALGMQSAVRVDDESLSVIEGSNAPIRESFEVVDRLFAAALESITQQGDVWPPSVKELTMYRCTFVFWNYACQFYSPCGKVTDDSQIKFLSQRAIPCTLLHLIGDWSYDKPCSAKLRQLYQSFCATFDPALLTEEVSSVPRSICKRNHDCYPFSYNPKAPLKTLLKSAYDSSFIFDNDDGDLTFSVRQKYDEDDLFRHISRLSVSSDRVSSSTSGDTPPQAPYQRMYLELIYQGGSSRREAGLQQCWNTGCQSQWVISQGLPWWVDYSPYEPKIPSQREYERSVAASAGPDASVDGQ